MLKLPVPLWRLTAVAVVGCTDASSNRVADSGAPYDTGSMGECEPHRTPSTDGCLAIMYDDLRGYGRRPDEHRMLYDAAGLLQSYDFAVLYADEYFVCGYEWTGKEPSHSRNGATVKPSTHTDGNTMPMDMQVPNIMTGASDGEIDRTWLYEVDQDGRITEEALDQDLDGTPDSFIWYQYNDEGLLLSDSWDYHGDQVVDYARDYFYDFHRTSRSRLGRQRC